MWKEADEETSKLMLKVAGREKQGHWGLEDIRQFPCEDLRNIDQLWIDYRNRPFGFSVQKEIYLSVRGILEESQSSSLYIKNILSPIRWIYTRFGGKRRDESDQVCDAYSRLGVEVGWKVRTGIDYEPPSHRGHFPRSLSGNPSSRTVRKQYSSFASRLVRFNI